MTRVFNGDYFSYDVPDLPYIAVEFDWEDTQEAKGGSETDKVLELWLEPYRRVAGFELVNMVNHPVKSGVLLAIFRNLSWSPPK